MLEPKKLLEQYYRIREHYSRRGTCVFKADIEERIQRYLDIQQKMSDILENYIELGQIVERFYEKIELNKSEDLAFERFIKLTESEEN